jgi:uncharacterized membrane protein (UPF0127 family)
LNPLLSAALIATVLVLGASMVQAQQSSGLPVSPLSIVTATEEHRFTVEIAATESHRSRGLMYRRSMAPDAGMLFDYHQPQVVAMWMANTFIPLDMLFIAADGRIVNIAERTVPQSRMPIPSAEPVQAVLELNGGTVDRLGIKPGDRVKHAIFGENR